MAKVVHGLDGYTGLQMREENAWGSDTGVTTYVDVPFVGESMKPVVDLTPPRPEFGEIGAEKTSDYRDPRVEGELSFQARIDAPWFNILLGHMFGEEKKRDEKYIDESAMTGANTHWFLQNNTARSLQFLVWKSGPDNAGYTAKFAGMQVASWRIAWDEGGLPLFTVAFVGKDETDAAVAGSLGTPLGDIITSQRWLTNTGGGFSIGTSLGEIEISSFSISCDRALTPDRSYITSLTAVNQPGPTKARTVTCDITALLPQNYAASGQAYYEYLQKSASTCQIMFKDTVEVVSGKPYAMMIDFPNIKWTQGDASISEAGANTLKMSFRAYEGSTTARILDTGRTDVRMATTATDAEDANGYFAAKVVHS